MNKQVQVLIDWLTFSVKGAESASEVIKDWLGLEPDMFQEMDYHSFMGYSNVKSFGNILVCSEGREDEHFHDMGICVSMSGNGCRTFETMSKLTFPGATDKQGTQSTAFPVLFQKIAADENAHVSRIDIACDDRAEILDMGAIIEKSMKHEVNSRMKKTRLVKDLDGSESNGATVYFGSEKSSFRLRIYDKAAQQGESGHWVRVEMVLKDKNAGAFVREMTNSENVGKLASQVLNDKFAFIEMDDSNISRCTVTGWWSDFVSELEEVHLVARKVIQHTVEQLGNWLGYQVAPTLAIIMKTLGWPYLFQMAKDAGARLSDKQRSLITDYNSLQGCYA